MLIRILSMVAMLMSASMLVRAEQPDAIVSFSFDDAPKSVVEVGLPIMVKNHLQATLYISTRNTKWPGYMNWDDIALAASHGWEIGAHTHTHPDLTKLSNEQILEELLTSTQMFASHGYSPVHFSTPFGAFDDRVLEILERHYESHRTAWPQGFNTVNPDPYLIASYYIVRDTTIEEISKLLDDLQKTGGWLVFQLHHVTPKGEVVSDEYDTTLLEDIVRQVKVRGIPTRTVGEALKQLKAKEKS